MSLEHLDFAEPFFDVKHIENLSTHHIEGRAIVLNLSDQPIQVEAQEITYLQSNIVADITLKNVQRAVVIERFDAHDDDAILFEQVKQHWPSAYEVRKEERLRGVSHYMSPKVWVRRCCSRSKSIVVSSRAPLCRPAAKEPSAPGLTTIARTIGSARSQPTRLKPWLWSCSSCGASEDS